MGDSGTLLGRLRQSPRAIAAAGIAVLALAGAVLISQIGLPPRRALFTSGIAAVVLMFAAYDWFVRE